MFSACHAAIVYDREESDEDGEGAGPRERHFYGGKKFTEVNDEKICDRRCRSNPREPQQPAILDSEKASEGSVGVEVRTPGFAKLGGHFGQAPRNDGNSGKCNEKAKGAPFAEPRGQQRGQAKNTGADHGVDHERREAPAADGANEPGLGFSQMRFRLYSMKRCYENKTCARLA